MNNNFLISLLLFLFISNVLAQEVDEESCPENEVPTPCVPCEGNCSNPNPVCIQVCIERNETICRCRDGYVRENGTCIRLDQCPNSNITCGKNEVPTNCLPCEGNCSNPNPICPLAICIPINDTVCRCRDGYVRENGTCIRKDQCDNANSTCGKNEVPAPCVPCEGTCSNPNPICPLICIESNDTICECKEGYVRENGTCIRLDQCENTCGPNEVPTTCRPCEGTCSNPNPICPRICIESDRTHCRCRNGYVREDDECIPEETCPSTRCCTFYYCIGCAANSRCEHSEYFPYRPKCVPRRQNCGIVPCRPGHRCVVVRGAPRCVPSFRYPPYFFPPRVPQ